MAQKRGGDRKRILWFVAPFFTVLLIFSVVIFAYINNRILLEQAQMQQIAMSRAAKVSDVLTALLYKTQVLSALVVQNDGEIEDFEKIASTIYDDPSIKNLILAPDGIVEYVYPLEGNEKVLKLDYFSDKAGNKEAILARDTGELVLGGPFSLVQGGEALVGRLPVYTSGNEFWGIASVTLNYPQALNGAELNLLKEQGYAFEIWHISPDTEEKQIIASSDYNYSRNSRYVEYPMNILNSEWYFRLSPIRAWYEFWETWVLISAALIISVMASSLLLHNYDLKNMKKDFENLSLIDPLTGIYNRRGGFQILNEFIGQKTPFVLCYMDLNNFKSINDVYGHHVGDTCLQRYVFSVRERIEGEDCIFARIGGDEFIFALRGDTGIDEIQNQLALSIAKLQEDKIVLSGKNIAMSFSAGYAVFPTDGGTADELLAIADKKMYRDKDRCKDLDKDKK